MQEHDPGALEAGSQLASIIRRSVPRIRVEPVGSSAVPGLAGKGVIDMAVEVPAPRIHEVAKALMGLGFEAQSGRDPFPETRPMLEGTFEHGGKGYSLHCHVLPEDGHEFQELVAFREALRTDPALGRRYEEAKRRIIAAGVTDRVTYAIAKGAFVAQVLRSRRIARPGYGYTPEDALHEASLVLGDLGPGETARWVMGQILGRLGREPGLLDRHRLGSLHGTGSAATILAAVPDGPTLMLARFPAEAPTPVHDHHTWGVACVVTGRDRYERWERLDDGSAPGVAKVRLAESLELGPGEWVGFGHPPHDIHRQQGRGQEAWELVLFGRNPNRRPRAYFDPDSGTVTYQTAT